MTSTLEYINQAIEYGLKDITRAAEIAAKIGTEDEKETIKYISLAEHYFSIQHQAKITERSLKLCEEADSIDGVDNILRDAKAENSKSRKSGSSLKEFKKKIEFLLCKPDESIRVTNESLDDIQTTFNDIDPITKRRIEHPVINSICKHIYDKQSILQAIQMNKRMRCPVVGCGNNEHVSQKHIVDDPSAVQRIRSSQQDTINITL